MRWEEKSKISKEWCGLGAPESNYETEESTIGMRRKLEDGIAVAKGGLLGSDD